MYDNIRLARRYIQYLIKARHSFGHGIHSPFLFHLISSVFFAKEDTAQYSRIYEYLKFLKKSNELIEVKEMGAGSKLSNSNMRKLSSIARNASTKKKYGKLLARLVSHFKPECIIELGTSLGMGTSYLAKNLLPGSRLYSIEGAENILSFAKQNCFSLKLPNVFPISGNFNDVLPGLLERIETVDMVYIDGNHRKEPTIKYFECLLPKLNNNSVLIIDDIHWSVEMELAWEYIKYHQSVKVSLDLFQIGLVLFKKELLKEDYIVRF